MLYKILFLSVWNYGILIWVGALTGSITPFETLNRRILKTILAKPMFFSTKALYSEFMVMDVRKQCCANMLKYCLKKQLIQFQQITPTTRENTHKYKAIAPRRKTKVAETCHTFLEMLRLHRRPTGILMLDCRSLLSFDFNSPL